MEHVIIHGTVIPGHNRGASLGFPTVNIDTVDLLPKKGIYAGYVELDDKKYKAAIHIGPVPSFGETEISVEAHLLDYTGDAYGKLVTLTCVKKIRNIENFDDLGSLIAQIEQDVEMVRAFLKE